MAGDAVKLLCLQHIFRRELFGLIDPAPYSWLRHSKIAGQLAIAARCVAAAYQRFRSGQFYAHEGMYTYTFRLRNVKVASAPIRIRID